MGIEPGNRKCAFVGPLTLHRASRVAGWVSIVVTLILVGFLVSVVIYAGEVRYEGFVPTGARSTGNNMALFGALVTLENPGIYPVHDFHLSIRVLQPTGELVAIGNSSTESLASGSTTSVPVYLPVNMALGAVQSLVTSDVTLHAIAWINATYATFFHLRAQLSEDYLWGAPFYGLKITEGNPVAGPNGTRDILFTLSFANHSPLPLYGTLHLVGTTGSGAICGGGFITLKNQSLAIVPPQSSFSGTTTFTVPSGCQPSGVETTYSNPLMNITLPQEAVP